MKTTAVTAWAQWRPFADGICTCSSGRSAAGFHSTIVPIETDTGPSGWGEYAPLGSFHDPAFVGRAREGLRLLAPLLIGYRRMQSKVGLDVIEDIDRMQQVCAVLPAGTVVCADANAAWRSAQAYEFSRATRALDYTYEQPCASFDENTHVRSDFDRPMVLDESIDSLQALLRAHHPGMVAGITIKSARVGWVTKARLIREVAVDCGLSVTIEDTGGAQIDTAAIADIAHLSLGVPESHRTHTVDFHHGVTVSNARFDFVCSEGHVNAPCGPGLGVQVDPAAFGDPILHAT